MARRADDDTETDLRRFFCMICEGAYPIQDCTVVCGGVNSSFPQTRSIQQLDDGIIV